MTPSGRARDGRRQTLPVLRADCANCAGLCCVAPAFAASADFAIDKPAGTPCPNLLADCRCGIHDQLRERGFTGCTVFDCFGAGQRVTAETFAGTDWRSGRAVAGPIFAVFDVVRALHELLWYLTESLAMPGTAPLHGRLEAAREETDRRCGGGVPELLAIDVDAHRAAVNALLTEASELARAGSGGRLLRGADLIGARFAGAELTGANLRGARLLGADLRRATLDRADLTGADLRGADLRGADLSGALFCTQAQLVAARGDRTTRLPPGRQFPAHWKVASLRGR